MTGIERNPERKINRLLELFPVVLIIGARQTGKTTLVKLCCPKWKYFDLEKGSDYDFISRDFDFFFRENRQNIIIDEAQELPQLFRELRGVIDSSRELNGRFLLTGSSSPQLLKEASDSLAGRMAIVEVGTLKINEIKQQKLPAFYELFKARIDKDSVEKLKGIEVDGVEKLIDHFLRGGYPQPVLKDNNEFYQSWMESYYHSYINRDVLKLFPKLDFIKFRRFINMLSTLSGTIINKSALGRSVDVSEVTIRDYLEIAHSTFPWRIIPSFEGSKSKSIVKMPKGIFRDAGLAHYLSGINNREELLRSSIVGHSFESFIIEELLKGIEVLSIPKWDYSYYRTRNGAEIDLILKGAFGMLPIEVKFGSSTTLKQLTSIRKFIAENALPLGIVINNSTEVKMLCDSVIQIPACSI